MSTEHGIGSVLSVGVQVRVVFARESSAYAVQCHWVAFAIGPMAFSETPSHSGLTHCSHILSSVTGLQIFEKCVEVKKLLRIVGGGKGGRYSLQLRIGREILKQGASGRVYAHVIGSPLTYEIMFVWLCFDYDLRDDLGPGRDRH